MDLVEHANEEENAVEEFRQVLNSIIGKYKLHPSMVLSMLANLTAGYINLTQAYYNKKTDGEVVQADYLNMLTAHLVDNAIRDFQKAQET